MPSALFLQHDRHARSEGPGERASVRDTRGRGDETRPVLHFSCSPQRPSPRLPLNKPRNSERPRSHENPYSSNVISEHHVADPGSGANSAELSPAHQIEARSPSQGGREGLRSPLQRLPLPKGGTT